MSGRPQEDTNQTTFSSETPHFFKIILEETLQENKLRIPQRFARKYGETLSNSVFVKLPCGSKWKIKLTKEEDNIWFEKGWPDFVKHYSIKRGSMLAFRYEGNSEFHAVIFDTSTVEIDYPSIPVDFDRSDIDLELRVSTEKVVQILDDLSPCPKAREKSPLPCSQPYKRMRKVPNGVTQRNSSDPISKGSLHSKCVLENSMSKENLQSTEPEMIGKHDLASKSDKDKFTTNSQRIHRILRHLKPPISRSEKVVSLQKASDFKSRRPFFKVVIQPSYICGNHLNFSPEFAMRHLKNESSDATLIVSSRKRTWSVAYSFRVYKRIKTARFKSGWSTFARDNNLEVGDTCVFVLLEDTRTAFEVVIFRGNENSNSISPAHESVSNQEKLEESPTKKCFGNKFPANGCKSNPWKTSQNTEPQLFGMQFPLTLDKKVRLLEKAPFESNKPFCRVVMQPSYRCQVNIKLDLDERHIKNEGDIVLSIPNGRSWSAQLRKRSLKTGKFAAVIASGWNQFVVDNNLKVGDVCIFELLNETKISFQVSIVRVSDDKSHSGSQAGDFAKGADKPKGNEIAKVEID